MMKKSDKSFIIDVFKGKFNFDMSIKVSKCHP